MSRAAWIKAALLLGVAACAWWALRACGLNVFTLTPERIREFVASFGAWGPVAYLALFGQPVIPVPASIVIIAAGLAFGPWWGTAAAMTGAILRAATQYVLARRVGREPIDRLLHGRMTAINRMITRHAFRSVLLIRIIPNFPYDVQNLSLGCSDVPLLPYLAATAVGIFPTTLGFVYFGHALTTPRALGITAVVLLLIVGWAWVHSGKHLAKESDATR